MCLGSRLDETIGLAVARRGLKLAHSRREPNDDWPNPFSRKKKLFESHERGFIGQYHLKDLIGRTNNSKRA
jgi:hypothetical protein